MPPYKRKRTAKQRSNAKKRARTYSSIPLPVRQEEKTTTVVRGPGPIPDRCIAKHRYVDEFASDNARADWELNLNSTYSPRYSPSGGHQPYGRDTYVTLYNRYRVFAVRYKVTFDAVATATGNYRGLIVLNNQLGSESNYLTSQEKPHSRFVSFAYQNSKTVYGYISLPKLNGQTRTSYMGDDRYQALTTASPTENMIMHIVMTDNGGSALNTGIGSIRVELTYYTEWFDPQTLAGS